MLRAFSDDKYDYYELMRPLGFNNSGDCIKEHILPKGSIFVHDKNDNKLGTIGDGCLKLCWTPEGNCYGCLCGGSMMFHPLFKNTDLFKLVQPSKEIGQVEKFEKSISDIKNQLNIIKEQLIELKG